MKSGMIADIIIVDALRIVWCLDAGSPEDICDGRSTLIHSLDKLGIGKLDSLVNNHGNQH